MSKFIKIENRYGLVKNGIVPYGTVWFSILFSTNMLSLTGQSRQGRNIGRKKTTCLDSKFRQGRNIGRKKQPALIPSPVRDDISVEKNNLS